jgi:DNA mismatch repair protein MutS
MSASNIYAEYFQLTNNYKQKYGEHTIVLLQVGAFYEVYACKNPQTNVISESQIIDFSQICSLNISEKKTTYKTDMIVMAGFRDYTLDKYLHKLTENHYTAVVYIQEKDGKNIKRVFHSVHSAGTYMSFDTELSSHITNNIMCIWIETFNSIIKSSNHAENIIYGVAVSNIFTGKSSIFEYQTPYILNPTTFDELERYISVYSPSEIIIVSTFAKSTIDTILQYSGVKTSQIHYVNLNAEAEPTNYSPDQTEIVNESNTEKAINCTKQNYIQHILSTYFGEDVYNQCFEFTSYTIATQSFCFLLNFIQEHNPNLVRNIELPVFNNTSDRMILANHTLKQLNIIDDLTNDGKLTGSMSSVLSFLNKCCCPMGRRSFQTQMVNPVFNEDWLENEYDMIEKMVNPSNYVLIEPFRKLLRQVCDIEKFCRHIVIQKIYPSSIYNLYKSVYTIQQINVCLYEMPFICEYLCADFKTVVLNTVHSDSDSDNSLYEKEIINDTYIDGSSDDSVINYYKYIDNGCSKFLEFIDNFVNTELCKNTNSVSVFEESIIRKGVSPVLDELNRQYENYTYLINIMRERFNTLMCNKENGTIDTDYIKIHETDKMGISLQLTKKRGTALKEVLAKLVKTNEDAFIQIDSEHSIKIKDISFTTSSGTNVEICIPLLSKFSKKLLTIRDDINETTRKIFEEFITKLETEWLIQLDNLAKYITKLDVLQSKTYVAYKYNYCKPIICRKSNNSFINATDLRHCLIEHLNKTELYVPNDIILGNGEPEEFDSTEKTVVNSNNMLLYGINAVGKTSLIRATGISIIMAQCGMYVPCSQFTYKPYTAIYSRISGNDNIFKGLSSFAVEMSELRVILKNADKNSIVLGDELCSGTETESALSIFITSLLQLYNNNTSFIFATHFHEILKFDEIKQMPRLSIKHMSVHYDRELDSLVYNRKLLDGNGSQMYGLEVCKSMYLEKDFIDKAYFIRNKYFKETQGGLSLKPSSYNSNKIRGLCEKCAKNMGQETHHINQQRNASNNGYINTIYKNHPANLMSVCEKCHDEIHVQSSAVVSNESPDVIKKYSKNIKLNSAK